MYASFDFTRRIVPETSTSFIVVPFQLAGSSFDLSFSTGQYLDINGNSIAITDVLSCSRASVAYATDLSDSLIQFSADTLRITNRGLFVENASTNDVSWSNDLTQAVWSATNITPLMDQTGPEGGANSASSILATAANGTILQAVTDTSTERCQTAYVKRLVGTGTINMTMDNGATWTAITVTSNWTRVSIPNQTLANPTVGFRIVTSGDKIAVAFVQNEHNPVTGSQFPTSPILTTTTAGVRAADTVECIGNLKTLVTALPFSVVMNLISEFPNNAFWVFFGDNTGDRAFLYTSVSDFIVSSVISGNTITKNFLPGLYSTGVKLGIAQATGARSLTAQGLDVASDANAGAAGTTNHPALGSEGGVNQMFGYIRRATFWNSKLTDTALKGFTTP